MKDLKQEPYENAISRGRWLETSTRGEINGNAQRVKGYSCSECGAISIFRMLSGRIVNGRLCPCCGAEMEDKKGKSL